MRAWEGMPFLAFDVVVAAAPCGIRASGGWQKQKVTVVKERHGSENIIDPSRDGQLVAKRSIFELSNHLNFTIIACTVKRCRSTPLWLQVPQIPRSCICRDDHAIDELPALKNPNDLQCRIIDSLSSAFVPTSAILYFVPTLRRDMRLFRTTSWIQR